MNFATLDDSMFRQDGIYVYTHGLMIDEFPFILYFHDTDIKKIFSHEKEIAEFLKTNAYGRKIYACKHYEDMYPGLRKYISESVNRRNKNKLRGDIKKSFNESHNYAKEAAKTKLELILSNKNAFLSNPQSLKIQKPTKTFYGHDRLF
jgi:hypothetical protein